MGRLKQVKKGHFIGQKWSPTLPSKHQRAKVIVLFPFDFGDSEREASTP